MMRLSLSLASVALLTCLINSCRHAASGSTTTQSPEAHGQVPAVAADPGVPPTAPVASTPVLATTPVVAPAEVDFTRDLRPILEARCKPCHFSGGMMYERFPFDRPETIHLLGMKLFGRIKGEDEQSVIRRFLAQDVN
jgi:hypothetical protein